MRDLKEYIVEGILNIDDNIENIDKQVIEEFLNNNYNGDWTISDKRDKDGKYEVSGNKYIIVENRKITSLTNGMFIWTNVDGDFSCEDCESLTSLEGAPEKVGGGFYCNLCKSLKSLEGAPEKVGGGFYCNFCNSLTSLKGAPKEVGEDFICVECKSLKSLKGAPKKVVDIFDCRGCESLTSLEGAPEKVGGDFKCNRCNVMFTKKDVKKVSNVKGMITV